MIAAAFFIGSFLAGLAALAAVLRAAPGFGAAAPNVRSNHTRPTPQLGGIAMVPVWLAAMFSASAAGVPVPVFGEPATLAAVTILFATGAADDARALGPLPKLALQVAAAGLAAYALRDLLAATPVPLALALPIATFFLVAMVTLTNVIDGIDLMAVATVGVPGAAFALLAAAGVVGAAQAPAGWALAGLFCAFAFFNRTPARSFLGDSGSLPFGLVLGVMTLVVACEADPLLAVLLPAYILFDGGFTLLRRAWNRENLLKAHSTHVYQRAFRGGRSAVTVSGAVAAYGAACGLLAWLAAAHGGPGASIAALLAAVAGWFGLTRALLPR